MPRTTIGFLTLIAIFGIGLALLSIAGPANAYTMKGTWETNVLEVSWELDRDASYSELGNPAYRRFYTHTGTDVASFVFNGQTTTCDEVEIGVDTLNNWVSVGVDACDGSGAIALFRGSVASLDLPEFIRIADWDTAFHQQNPITAASTDSDLDGVPDWADVCVSVADPDQLELYDGYGVMCSMDFDDNGLSDAADYLKCTARYNKSPGPGCVDFTSGCE